MKFMKLRLVHERHERDLIVSQLAREHNKLCLDTNQTRTAKNFAMFCYKHRLWKRYEYLHGKVKNDLPTGAFRL